jgi:TonB family protein
MKTLIAAAIAASLALPAGSAVAESIVVQHPSTSQGAWVKDVSSELRTKLRYPMVSYQSTGAVSVRFRCGADGRAQEVSVIRPSGYRSFDKEAVRAVNHLTRLGAGPNRSFSGRMVRADIIFAEREDQLPALARQLREDNARIARAQAPGNPPELVLSVGSATQG